MLLTCAGVKPDTLYKFKEKVRVNTVDKDCIIVEQTAGAITRVYDAPITIGDTIIITGYIYGTGGYKSPFTGHFEVSDEQK